MKELGSPPGKPVLWTVKNKKTGQVVTTTAQTAYDAVVRNLGWTFDDVDDLHHAEEQ